MEVIRYWLSTHNFAVTWTDVAELLTKAELHQLATAVMGYHETGIYCEIDLWTVLRLF